jgi:hypothetical protein
MKMLMKSITLERAIVCALFLVCLTISIFRPGYYRGGVSFSSKLRNDFSKTLSGPVPNIIEEPWKSVNRVVTVGKSATSTLAKDITLRKQPQRQQPLQQQQQQQQQQQRNDHPQQPLPVPQPVITNRKLRAFIFTMDSLSGFTENAKRGGAAGELIVREALQWALSELGVEIIVADSDESMEKLTSGGLATKYDLFFFDPWTVTDKNMQLRSYLLGREKSVYILSFFGWAPSSYGYLIPEANVLTAYPNTPGGAFSFLGFIIEPLSLPSTSMELITNKKDKKKRSGVIWGKKPAYFEGREQMLDALLRDESLGLDELHFIGVENGQRPASGKSAVYHGHLDRSQWQSLLSESSFLLGLGNPLLGPSALEALAAGAMYLDPTYDRKTRPLTDVSPLFKSQHPFLREFVGEPYVCSISDVTSYDSVRPCIVKALSTQLDPLVEKSFTRPEYLKRVQTIVDTYSLQLDM